VSQIRVIYHKSLENILTEDELSSLKADFASYKGSGEIPDTFGRDALYNHPHSLPVVLNEELAHIHLADDETNWPKDRPQYQCTSDKHLVYCQGYNDRNCYLLMAILAPDAHDKANNNTIMHNLGKMAEKFRNQY